MTLCICFRQNWFRHVDRRPSVHCSCETRSFGRQTADVACRPSPWQRVSTLSAAPCVIIIITVIMSETVIVVISGSQVSEAWRDGSQCYCKPVTSSSHWASSSSAAAAAGWFHSQVCRHSNVNIPGYFKRALCLCYTVDTRRDCLVLSCLVRVGGVNGIGDKSRVSATENFETVLSSLEMRCEQSSVLSRPSFQFSTRTCLQTRLHCRQDWTKLFSLQCIEDYWKQSWLVSNSVHIINNTRQDSLVLLVSVVWTMHQKRLENFSSLTGTYSALMALQ